MQAHKTRKQATPVKHESSIGINQSDLIKPSKLSFAMLKKARKTAPQSTESVNHSVLLSEREAVVSFAETQMDFDPNHMPQRAVNKFTRHSDTEMLLSALENRDKKLV